MSWFYWNIDCSDTTISTSTTTGAWSEWTSTSTSNTWIVWTGGAGSAAIQIDTSITISDCTIWGYWVEELPTAEEMEDCQRVIDEQRQRREESRQQAELTAMELLSDLLNEEEMAVYQKTGRVLVRGQKYDYLILKESGWVKRIGKDSTDNFCMHIVDRHGFVPTDNVISMKLFLEAREKQFLREANHQGACQLDNYDRECLKRLAVNQ